MQFDEREIRLILDRHYSTCDGFVAVLEEIQTSFGYLPEPVLRKVGELTGRSMADIYEAASYYPSFTLEPRGRHHVCVCTGSTCHANGSALVLKKLEEQFKVKAGSASADGQVFLETTNCQGMCDMGPIVVVDGIYHSKVKEDSVSKLIDRIKEEESPKPSVE